MIVRVSPRLMEVGGVKGNSVGSLLCSDQGGWSRARGQSGPGPGPRPRPLAVRAKNDNIISLRIKTKIQKYLYLFRNHNLLKSVNSVNILLCEVCSASAKDFLVLLKAIIAGDKCKNVTHDLICLLASLMENLRLVRCTARPSRPITTMLGFSTLRLSSGNTRQH